MNGKQTFAWGSRIALPTGALVAAFVLFLVIRAERQVGLDRSRERSSCSTPVEEIALANLKCAERLLGAEGLILENCLRDLTTWTERVRAETDRHFYRFRANPADFENSEGYFRMLIMAVVLYEDFGVRYNPGRISASEASQNDDHFFSDSHDVFLHGLLGPQRVGTCSSMPVLYVAIGRRLGYPLKLVTTKGHLFLRWEGNGERFNMEATGKGMNRYDDEYFKQWPYPVTDDEIEADGFLKSLTPTEELALFKSIRGHCLMEAHRYTDAEAAYAEAQRLAPNARGYHLLHENCLRALELAQKEQR